MEDMITQVNTQPAPHHLGLPVPDPQGWNIEYQGLRSHPGWMCLFW